MPAIKNITLLILLFSVSAHAQHEGSIWVFGDSAGIDFRDTSAPQAFASASNINIENNSCISNNEGSLLFYIEKYYGTGGVNDLFRVRNLNGVFPNGDSIQAAETISQGSIIIPKPGDTTRFFLFTLQLHSPQVTALYYAIVRLITQGQGLAESKNIVLQKCDTLDRFCPTERLQAVKHANGKDWWILNQTVDSNTFVRYLITANGIAGP